MKRMRTLLALAVVLFIGVTPAMAHETTVTEAREEIGTREFVMQCFREAIKAIEGDSEVELIQHTMELYTKGKAIFTNPPRSKSDVYCIVASEGYELTGVPTLTEHDCRMGRCQKTLFEMETDQNDRGKRLCFEAMVWREAHVGGGPGHGKWTIEVHARRIKDEALISVGGVQETLDKCWEKVQSTLD